MSYKPVFIGAFVGLAAGPLLGLFVRNIGGDSSLGELGFYYAAFLAILPVKIVETMGLLPQNTTVTWMIGITFYIIVGALIGWLDIVGYRWNFDKDGLGTTKTSVK